MNTENTNYFPDENEIKLTSPTGFPIDFSVTLQKQINNNQPALSFDIKSTNTSNGITRSGYYYIDNREHNSYIDFFAKLASDFGLRTPQNRLKRKNYTFRANYREVLTENLSPGMIYGYGDPAATLVNINDKQRYYLVSTSNDAADSFPIIKSNNLIDWEFVDYIFPRGKKPAWASDGEFVSDYWAAEMHKVAGEYLACFVARDKSTLELCIGLAKASSPDGPFTPESEPILKNNVIDPHIFVENENRVFLCWKEDNNSVWPMFLSDFLYNNPTLLADLFTNEQDQLTVAFTLTLWPWIKSLEPMERFMTQQLFIEVVTAMFSSFYDRLLSFKEIQPPEIERQIEQTLHYMKTPVYMQQLSIEGLQLTGDRIKIIENDLAWEAHLVEGIWLTKQNGKYYLFYAGNDFSTDQYGIGVAIAQEFCGPYKKMPKQLLQSTAEWWAPGHPSVVHGPDGNPILLFHAFFPEQAGYKQFRALLSAEMVFSGENVTLSARHSVIS